MNTKTQGVEYKKKETIHSNQFWFPLDNAAKIFPATITREVTTVFRVGAVLKDTIKIKPFMQAVAIAENRFPYYKVRLKKGLFWYYLEYFPNRFPVIADNLEPCRMFQKNGLLVRVLVKNNCVSVEFSHVLTDGSGAYEFLKTLLLTYLEQLGTTIPENYNFYKPGDEIDEEEYEDAYQRYFKEKIPGMVKRSKAFHLPWSLKPAPRFRVRQACIPMDSIKPKAVEKGVSITDYLVAVLLHTLQEIHEDNGTPGRYKKHKFLRIQVPVNLRNILPSKTMRNFSLFVIPEIDTRLGHYTFDEILKTVYHQMRLETDEKLIHKNISRNVQSERKIFVKSIPLFIKNMIIRKKYYSMGTSQYSSVITNLGKVKLPDELARMVDHFVFTPPPPNKMLKVNCGVIGFDNKQVISFGNITRSTVVEEKFTEFLKSRGIEVHDINNNR